MIYRCRRRKRKFSRLRKLLWRSATIIIVLTVGLIILCESKLEYFMPEFIRTQSELMSSTAINDAVQNTLDELNYSYDDIAVINYSNSGRVQSIQTNTIKLDKIKIAVTKSAQEEIAKIYDCEVDIPLGAFTDIAFLSNAGP
ncbi:MAG: hypothetical protein Q4A46_06195, partial [Clostridia bacterium]|nr:hypothetical protein [Clostridia bacterium]